MNTTTMTEQEINIMIAELCGWTMIHIETELNPDKYRRTYLAGKSPLVISDCEIEDYFKMEVPHYATNLNAMHDAENLCDGQWMSYERNLQRVCRCNPIVRATARQRAEALIATLAK